MRKKRNNRLERRGFVKVCASAVAAVSTNPKVLSASAFTPPKLYERVRLVANNNTPLKASDLEVGVSYVFNYPFGTTPCFLINLGKTVTNHTKPLSTEAGQSYVWQGGVGPRNSIVSFAAICAHKLTHPAKAVSFINYRHETVSFRNHEEDLVNQKQVIFCCSEKSVYDPTDGARVLAGPAKQPLAAILLKYEADSDELHALGTYGGELYDKFFEKFSYRLALENNTSNVQSIVTKTARIQTIVEYSSTMMLC